MRNKDTLIGFVGMILMIGFISLVSAQTYSCPSGMMSGFSGGYGLGTMIFSWSISLLIIALIVTAIYWLINSANQKNNKNKRR